MRKKSTPVICLLAVFVFAFVGVGSLCVRKDELVAELKIRKIGFPAKSGIFFVYSELCSLSPKLVLDLETNFSHIKDRFKSIRVYKLEQAFPLQANTIMFKRENDYCIYEGDLTLADFRNSAEIFFNQVTESVSIKNLKQLDKNSNRLFFVYSHRHKALREMERTLLSSLKKELYLFNFYKVKANHKLIRAIEFAIRMKYGPYQSEALFLENQRNLQALQQQYERRSRKGFIFLFKVGGGNFEDAERRVVLQELTLKDPPSFYKLIKANLHTCFNFNMRLVFFLKLTRKDVIFIVSDERLAQHVYARDKALQALRRLEKNGLPFFEDRFFVFVDYSNKYFWKIRKIFAIHVPIEKVFVAMASFASARLYLFNAFPVDLFSNFDDVFAKRGRFVEWRIVLENIREGSFIEIDASRLMDVLKNYYVTERNAVLLLQTSPFCRMCSIYNCLLSLVRETPEFGQITLIKTESSFSEIMPSIGLFQGQELAALKIVLGGSVKSTQEKFFQELRQFLLRHV